MKLSLKQGGRTLDVSGLYQSVTWSGDKGAVSRELAVSLVSGEGLPEAGIGDRLILEEGRTLFTGLILRRQKSTDGSLVTLTAQDDGTRMHGNDVTAKFGKAAPEDITRSICKAKNIPVARLPQTGCTVRRIFAGVPIDQAVRTIWTLAAEQTGDSYLAVWTPEGLAVRKRTGTAAPLILEGDSNLMNAVVTEDATRVVTAVAVYDANGNFLRRVEGNREAARLLGTLERHVRQTKNGAGKADEAARRLLREGDMSRTVTAHVLGNVSLTTGETVVIREEASGLTGTFWIDHDVHTWKNGNYYTALSLNCRNVAAEAWAGSEGKA